MTTQSPSTTGLPQALVDRLVEALGEDAVLLERAEVDQYRDPYWVAGDDTYAGAAVVCPTTTEQVQTVVRLATVGPLSGTREVSASITWTSSSGQPSASAAICDNTVTMPWPISVVPTATVTLPSPATTTFAPAGFRCLPIEPRPTP